MREYNEAKSCFPYNDKIGKEVKISEWHAVRKENSNTKRFYGWVRMSESGCGDDLSVAYTYGALINWSYSYLLLV